MRKKVKMVDWPIGKMVNLPVNEMAMVKARMNFFNSWNILNEICHKRRKRNQTVFNFLKKTFFFLFYFPKRLFLDPPKFFSHYSTFSCLASSLLSVKKCHLINRSFEKLVNKLEKIFLEPKHFASPFVPQTSEIIFCNCYFYCQVKNDQSNKCCNLIWTIHSFNTAKWDIKF